MWNWKRKNWEAERRELIQNSTNGKYFNRLYKLCIQIFQVAAKPSVFLLCFVLFINSVVIPIRRVAIHSSRIIVVQFTRNERNGRKKKKNKCTHKKTFEWIFAGIVFENNRRLMRKLNAIPNFQLGMHLYEYEVCGDDLLRRALERANSKCFSLF